MSKVKQGLVPEAKKSLYMSNAEALADSPHLSIQRKLNPGKTYSSAAAEPIQRNEDPSLTDKIKSAVAGSTAGKIAANTVAKVGKAMSLREELVEEHQKDPAKSRLTKAAELNTHGIKTATRKYHSKEKMLHFRIDWVRNLEMSLTGKQSKMTSHFDPEQDRELLLAIFSFQVMHFGKDGADGVIGGGTRAKLEEVYPSLQNKALGEHTKEEDVDRVLVGAGLTDEDKYNYYRSIIQSTGGIFYTLPNKVNVLAIRGVSKDADGTIRQTGGAKAAKEALDAGKQTNYFNSVDVDWAGETRAADDLIVSLWMDKEGIHVKERMGTTEFASAVNKKGGPTIRDGQYMYELQRHNTKGTHAANVKKKTGAGKRSSKRTKSEQAAHDLLDPSSSGKSYNALVPHDKFEVYRSGSKSDKNLSQKDIDRADKQIGKQDNDYIGNQYINFHTTKEGGVSSAGCQNLEFDKYVEFLKEISDNKAAYEANMEAIIQYLGKTLGANEEQIATFVKKAKNNENTRYTIPYTLIDASKIDKGLQVVIQEEKEVTK